MSYQSIVKNASFLHADCLPFEKLLFFITFNTYFLWYATFFIYSNKLTEKLSSSPYWSIIVPTGLSLDVLFTPQVNFFIYLYFFVLNFHWGNFISQFFSTTGASSFDWFIIPLPWLSLAVLLTPEVKLFYFSIFSSFSLSKFYFTILFHYWSYFGMLFSRVSLCH